MTKLSARIETDMGGFTLVEVLVAAVIFAGVFLLMFTLLGSIMIRTSGADQLRAAAIADARLASYYSNGSRLAGEEIVTVDGVRYRVLSSVQADHFRERLRLVVLRLASGDTVGSFHAIRYVSGIEDDHRFGTR